MINKNVTTALQTLNGITNTVIIKYPTTIVNSGAGDVIVKLDMAKLDSESFPDIGIYNLGEFLTRINLFGEDRKVSVEEGNVSISEGNRQTTLLSTALHLLEDYNKDETNFTKTESVPTVASFTLTNEDMKTIKSASGAFKDLTEIVITSQDGGIEVALGAGASFNAKTNSFSVALPAETSKEFSLNISAQNFNNLPNSDYNVQVKYNSSRDAYRILLDSTEIDMQILLAVKK